MAGNIVLIGFMAVGKGRTARELSRRTGRYAVDSDDLIESLAKMKIKSIFKQFGEQHFRDLERLTADWLERRVSGSIVSTGGGFVMVPNLPKIGTVIYLHNDFDDIVDRIMSHPKAEKKIKKRPLLQDLAQAEALYLQRLPLYRAAADKELPVRGKSTAEVATDIMAMLGLEPVSHSVFTT